MRARQRLLCVFLVACGACDALSLKSDPTKLTEFGRLCMEAPQDPECADALREHCADHPDDQKWCRDAGQGDPDGSMGLDAGCCTARDGSVAGEGGIAADGGPDASADGGCKNCPMPECLTKSDCKGKAGGEYCSAAMTCVQCVESTNCATTDPVCTSNTCMGCTKKTDCTARTATPACDMPSGDCVECTSTDAAKCAASSEVCKAGGTECVQCNVNADCKDGTKPICGANNMCRGCTAESDCQGAGQVCREATGECVACEPNADNPSAENCSNGNACHPVQFTCTGKVRGSVNGCQSCISDSECFAGTRCVATNFKGAPHGSYCLVEVASDGDSCPQQTNKNRASTSVLGRSARYCFPADSLTTCEAIKAFGGAGCGTSDASCGAADLNDGLCRSNKCTYSCGTADDCLGSTVMDSKCIGPIGSSYCDPN